MFKTILGILGISILIGGAIGAFTWTYAINYWLLYFGKPAAFLWWYGAILGLTPYVGYASIPIAAITFVLSFFI